MEVVQEESADVEKGLWHVGTEGLILEKQSCKRSMITPDIKILSPTILLLASLKLSTEQSNSLDFRVKQGSIQQSVTAPYPKSGLIKCPVPARESYGETYWFPVLVFIVRMVFCCEAMTTESVESWNNKHRSLTQARSPLQGSQPGTACL